MVSAYDPSGSSGRFALGRQRKRYERRFWPLADMRWCTANGRFWGAKRTWSPQRKMPAFEINRSKLRHRLELSLQYTLAYREKRPLAQTCNFALKTTYSILSAGSFGRALSSSRLSRRYSTCCCISSKTVIAWLARTILSLRFGVVGSCRTRLSTVVSTPRAKRSETVVMSSG